MSLFPAYSKESRNTEKNNERTYRGDNTWLNNSSFQTELLNTLQTRSDNGAKSKNDNVLKSSHFKGTSYLLEKNIECYYIDLKGKTPDIYDIKSLSFGIDKKIKTNKKIRKNTKFKRYFMWTVNIEEAISIQNDNDEQELTKKTAHFNQCLAASPQNIKMWLEYVDFQDIIYQFEKTHRKGSIAKAQRVLAERKISIIDKALSLNPKCEVLYRERLKVCVATYPEDELQILLQELVDKDKGNIILWQGYIEATQCSMAHCNTPAVITLYTKCLSTLHQLRRSTALEKYLLEENILRMLYQCGLFLKQAGLFEQLWTLLRMYLDLNLSPNDSSKFNIIPKCDENLLIELEEIILTSNLPIHELWLRIEKLRESWHWLPYVGEGRCADPQRLVFVDDVAELIHPITLPENIFKLIATIFFLLKIPLLPCRHTTMQELGFDYVPWSLDSVEPLLAMFFPLFPIDVMETNFLDDSRLAVGPQYLKAFPGREEFLEFVLKIMQTCAECLKGDDKISVMIWIFRFQRLLIILDKLKYSNMSENFKKQLKKNIKDFLKNPENRQNEIYYLEYALIEYELGNIEGSLKIIKTTLNIGRESIESRRASRCHLYCALVQLTLLKQREFTAKNEALEYLCELAVDPGVGITADVLKTAETKFNETSLQLLQNGMNRLETVKHFQPDFTSDWLICHGWFLYLKYGLEKCCDFMQSILKEIDQNDLFLWQKEVLYEFYISIIYKDTIDHPRGGTYQLLNEVLHRAIEYFPNNLFLLTVLTKQESLMQFTGPRWWKTQQLLLKSGRSFSVLFTIIILNQHISHLQNAITGKNRMLSLFKKITSTNPFTRRCGLIWRLYLRFIYTDFSPETCREVYYSAVEECPWLKALYIDAAVYIPAELSQIQDLIIEKQLRLHVTPEELDALRN